MLVVEGHDIQIQYWSIEHPRLMLMMCKLCC